MRSEEERKEGCCLRLKLAELKLVLVDMVRSS